MPHPLAASAAVLLVSRLVVAGCLLALGAVAIRRG
jgi:hypothetical protein